MNCPHCRTPIPDEARFCAACGKATTGTEPASSLHPHASGVPTPDPIGKEIAGRYRITAKLGEGGMGAVYKAEQMSLKRQCAVKVLRPDVAGAQIMLRRFNAEAEAVAKLSHPNTVNIYDFGQDTDGTFFIAMEYVEGKSLREIIHAEAPLAIPRSLHIASQVAASLVDAHAHSIIHRDLKPDNVMLQTRGRQRDVARVLDFGIAKLRDEGRATQAAMTQAGDMLGTPQYMAPEQIRAEQIDGRTDVYALGCMLYEMITARLPFEGPTLMALLSKHLMETPPPPSQRRPELGIPPMIDELIMTAIAKDPNARPPTMELFGEKINAILATMPVTSGGMSAVHGAVIPPAPAPGYATPQPAYGAPSQAYGAQQPQAGMHAPTPPPMGYPTPGVPMQQQQPMAPGGYGTPQAQYSPYAQPGVPPVTGAIPAPKGSNMLLIILIAVAALGALGVVLYFAVFKKSESAQVASGGDGGVADDPIKKGGDDPIKKGSNAEEPPKDPIKKGGDDPTKKGGDGEDDPEEDPKDPKDPDVWDGSGKPATGGGGDLLSQMQQYRDRMCACSEMTCATKVAQDMQKWTQDFANRGADMANMDAAAATKMGELGKEFAECTQTAMKQTAPPKPKPKPDVLTMVNGFAGRACKCTDVTCARAVVRDLLAYMRANPNVKNVNDAKVEASAQRMGACLVTAGMSQQEILKAVEQMQ